jgi:mRNA interferase MazF
LKRGEIWTGTGDVAYAGKPRPVVIVQSDHFEILDSVTVCGFTSDPLNMPLFRIPVQPTGVNGLQSSSRIMVDKILTVPKNKLGYRVGRLDPGDLTKLNQALATFLGFADVEPD